MKGDLLYLQIFLPWAAQITIAVHLPWNIPRPGVLNFELGTDVRPEVSTTTLQLNQRRCKFATYI